MHQLGQAKNVTALIFAAEIRRGRKAYKHLHLFSITIADINMALEKLDNSAVKQTVEEISNQLPQQLRHLTKNFLADGDGILPESKPGWDHSINLELDDEGKPKEPPPQIHFMACHETSSSFSIKLLQITYEKDGFAPAILLQMHRYYSQKNRAEVFDSVFIIVASIR
ncbi:hypothetical protein K3495_g13476 [Podosphaera aphanis]|nr:hypothetical protein K3495_g13476 [Podosphaera aphanis]